MLLVSAEARINQLFSRGGAHHMPKQCGLSGKCGSILPARDNGARNRLKAGSKRMARIGNSPRHQKSPLVGVSRRWRLSNPGLPRPFPAPTRLPLPSGWHRGALLAIIRTSYGQVGEVHAC